MTPSLSIRQSAAWRVAYASFPPGAQCPESQPEPVNWTDLNCHCMFVVGCLQGTGSLTGNLGQRKPTQRCQLRGKKKTDRGADMVTAWAHTHFFSYNHRGGDYKLWLRQPPAVCCEARYCEVTHAIKSQTRPRTRCGSWPNLACAWSHETTETLVWRFMVGRWWLMLCSLMQHLNKLPHHEVKWLCRMTKVHEERLQSEAVLEIGALHPSVLSRRQEISEDYRQRRVPAGHRNIQKYVINPHTHTRAHTLYTFAVWPWEVQIAIYIIRSLASGWT